MVDATRDPRLGTVLHERYRILARLGEGGMGVVYRAERIGLGRAVAVKFLLPTLAADEQFLRRFEREARAMSRLAHPHCVSVIDFGVADAPYIVMDLVTGRSLRELLKEGPLSPVRAVAIVRQVLAGLAHAHAEGITHRDIKPDNILLTNAIGTGDHVHILDFGLAKLHDARGGDFSSVLVAVGTPSYMAPEQARGEPADERTDVYAVGVTLFELLAGRKPFVSESAQDVLRMHLDTPPPRLHDQVPAVSPALSGVVQRALAKAPRDRFQSALELAGELEATPEWEARPRHTAPRPQVRPPEDVTVIATPTSRRATTSHRRSGGAGVALVILPIAAAAAWWVHRELRFTVDRVEPVTEARLAPPAPPPAPPIGLARPRAETAPPLPVGPPPLGEPGTRAAEGAAGGVASAPNGATAPETAAATGLGTTEPGAGPSPPAPTAGAGTSPGAGAPAVGGAVERTPPGVPGPTAPVAPSGPGAAPGGTPGANPSAPSHPAPPTVAPPGPSDPPAATPPADRPAPRDPAPAPAPPAPTAAGDAGIAASP